MNKLSWCDQARAWIRQVKSDNPDMLRQELRQLCLDNFPSEYSQTSWGRKSRAKALRLEGLGVNADKPEQIKVPDSINVDMFN